ncbi:MAG: NAD(P)-dependent oxidoreductase [Phycisphaeraceae bacterium]
MRVALFGATGRTGRLVLEHAIAEGHEVTVLVRSPQKLGEAPSSVSIVEGDMMNRADVARAVDGAHAVIMAAGPTKSSPTEMLEVSARNIVDAMREADVSRIVWLTGAGVVDERDRPALSRSLIRGLMKLVAGKVLRASERAYAVVAGAGLDYTVVRPPMLADEPGGVDLDGSYTPPKPIPVGRGDLARFLLDAAVKGEFVRESPFVSYRERAK